MDTSQLRQKSASQSSLRSTYRAHGRPANYTNPRSTAQRRPLRSVNENAALLRSPGPLESMLKTTTETGDIGIFSIQPRSSSPTYTRPQRAKQLLTDAALIPVHTRSRAYEEGYYSDKRLRAYRDTTSEIISLYGSESQQTLLTSVSPTSLDDGPRSYSMTTTSSKHIPSQKSSGTLQSQSSNGGLQRPRSPFPYPTRLKRPGVRPASPALGENGYIDYSRMVELNHFSQRTVHGSYKPTYTYGPRRPPPLSLRPEASRSTTSLPSRDSHSPYYYIQGPYRARTPNSSAPWIPRPMNRQQRISADHSSRSASLTSIVEMYNRPIAGKVNNVPLQSANPFYYDYSEEFENQPPCDIDLEIPICPIPQRAGSIHRPMVLKDDTEGSLNVAGDEMHSQKSSSEVVEKNDSLPPPSGTDDKIEDNVRDSVIDGKDESLVSPPTAPGIALDSELQPPSSRMSIKAGREEIGQPLPSPISPNTELCVPVTFKASEDAVSNTSSLTPQPEVGLDVPQVASNAMELCEGSSLRLPRLRYSIDPALSEFASILSSFDRLGKTLSVKEQTSIRSSSDDHDNISRLKANDDGQSIKVQLKRCPSLPPSGQLRDEKAYQKGHRRNIAAMRISNIGITHKDHTTEPSVPYKVPILSPEPISPVRQLRVKQSIPQLMKVLPPLPKETEQVSHVAIENATLTNMLRDQALQSDVVCYGNANFQIDLKPLPSPGEEVRETLDSLPRFRIRAKATPPLYGAANNACSVSTKKNDFNAKRKQDASPPGKPKLKLKVSRSQLGQIRPCPNASLIHMNRMKQCNSLAELAQFQKQTSLTDSKNLEETDEERVSTRVKSDYANPRKDGDKHLKPSPQPSDQFNIPYPPSPSEVKATPSPVVSNSNVSLTETQSFKLNIIPCKRQGFRGKLSMLRLRFIGTPSKSTPGGGRFAPLSDSDDMSKPQQTSFKSEEANPIMNFNAKGQGHSTKSDKTGWRVKRWAHDAKVAVRLYIKKTLDQSSTVSD